jgi:hypothetical protein
LPPGIEYKHAEAGMFDVIPEVLSRSHRGICPTCGAAMPLAESGREARCDFCGGGSTLQHRLRAIEASTGELQAPKIKGATRYEKCNCPGCGAEFDADTEQSIQTCKYCGTQSKLETRLVAITPEDVDPPQRRSDADRLNQSRKHVDYPWDVSTEQLCWRIIHEPELMPRVHFAQRFRNWNYINHTAVHFLPWVLKHVQTDDDMVALYACDAVGKLLCEGDPTLWPGTIQACRGVIFDVNAKRTILSELGLGKGVCVKTLIDAAEYAAVHGDRDYCCHALWAVNTLIGRNFPEHPTIAEIVLYRLFYVTGPVLGWALYTMRESYLRGRYPWQTLARAIDELAVERPEVVPHLLECFYATKAETPEDYRERVATVTNAQSWGGKSAGCEMLHYPPDDDALLAEALDAIDGALDDPHAGWSAENTLYKLVTAESKRTAPPLDALVRKRGESLSYRVKREYIRRNPETPLLDTSVRYNWQSDPKRELDPEMERLRGVWKEGIKSAVDSHRSQVDEWRKQAKAAEELEVELFIEKEPATIPLGEAYVAKIRAKEAEEAARDKQQTDLEALQSAYQARIEELSQKMMANVHDQALMRQASEEMSRVVQEMQDELQKLLKG